MSIYSSTLCTVKKLAPLDIANCNVFFEPKLSAGRPLRAARPSDAAAKVKSAGGPSRPITSILALSRVSQNIIRKKSNFFRENETSKYEEK